MGLFDGIKKFFNEVFDNEDTEENNDTAEGAVYGSAEKKTGEITTIDQLESKLQDSLDIVSLKGDNGAALAHVFRAQLQVIQVLKDPRLCNSAFDLLLESLNEVSQTASTETMVEMQRKTVLMVNSMLFFMEAYVIYKEHQLSRDAEDLLNKASDMLAQTATESLAGFGAVIVGPVLVKNIITSGFLGKVVGVIAAFFSGDKLRREYYDFLIKSFEKMERNRELLGKSLLLSELIHNKKEELAEYIYPPPDRPSYTGFFDIDEFLPWPMIIIFIVIVVFFLALGVTSLLHISAAVQWLWTAIKYAGIAEGAAILLIPAVNLCRFIAYKAAVSACLGNRAKAIAYFERIADSFRV
jgi:hypothetical protein